MLKLTVSLEIIKVLAQLFHFTDGKTEGGDCLRAKCQQGRARTVSQVPDAWSWVFPPSVMLTPPCGRLNLRERWIDQLNSLDRIMLYAKSLQFSDSLQPTRLPVQGILQARILEWVVISFFRASSWPRDWTLVSFCLSALADGCFYFFFPTSTIWETPW